MTSHELAAALVRTTLATSAAACLAVVLLGLLKVQSPRTHRVAWLLVILQGWLLIPWTLQFESPPAPPPAPTRARPSSAWAWEPIETTHAVVLTAESTAPPRDLADLAAPAALAAWGAGLAVAVLVAAWRYARIVRTLPLGAAPSDPQWRAEWRRAYRGLAHSHRGLAHFAQSAEQNVPVPFPRPVPMPRRKRSRQKRRVHFRISQSLGPLLAFVPWRYLILAPRPLWLALTADQREAILRHELAHLHRRDLWKSLAIRALALPQWFNPLAWLAVRRFDETAEWACDDAVARRDDAAPITLAQSLVRTAELLQTTPAAPVGVLPFHGGVLARRIHRLVTPRFKEESNMKRLIVPLLLAGLAAAQLIRIERVAASDPPPSQGGARGGISDSTAPHAEDATALADNTSRSRLSASAPMQSAPPSPADEQPSVPPQTNAERMAQSREDHDKLQDEVARAFESGDPRRYAAAVYKLPYVIEPPDILTVTLTSPQSKPLRFSDKSGTELSAESISLQSLVAPDGKIYLGANKGPGVISVAGLTLDQARNAILKFVKQDASPFKNVDQVDVQIFQNNSKVFYIITKGGEKGDDVVRVQVTGNETVLDAVATLGGLPRDADVRMWVARPAPNGVGAGTILPIAWRPLAQGIADETNYQLLPGDRLFIEPKQRMTAATAPVEARATADLVGYDAPAQPVKPASPVADPAYFAGDFRFSPRQHGGETVTIALISRDKSLDMQKEFPFTPGMSISDLLRTAKLPFPIDFASAMITRTRVSGSPDDRQSATWTGGGWDPIHGAPSAGEDQILKAGDRITIELPAAPPDLAPQANHPAANDGPAPANDESPVEALKRHRAVSISLTMPDGRRADWSEKLADGATIGQVLANATYPNPVDLAKAMIKVSRVHWVETEGRSAQARTFWMVGWDAESKSVVGPDNWRLQPGDQITIGFSAPPAPPAKSPQPQEIDGGVDSDKAPADGDQRERVVFLSLRMPDGKGVQWPVEIADGATIGQVLNNATYPNPVDFSKAMITLSRHARVWRDGRVTEARTNWAVGWDAKRHAPPIDDDRELQPGDSITIDLSPSPGVAILSDPPRDDVAPAPADRVGKLKVHDIVTVLVNYGGNPKEVLPQDFRIACEITELRANGNLGIAGQQTIRANGQQWQISLSGQVRREAIQADRTVSSDAVVNLNIYKREVRLEAPAVTADRDDVPADAEGADGDALTEANDENRPARPLAAALHDQLRLEPPAPPAQPPAPTPGTNAPRPAVAAAPQVMFKTSIIRDRSGDVADLGLGREGVGSTISDSATLLGALKVLKKHGLVEVVADPTIVTTVGRPAKLEIAGAAQRYGQGAAGQESGFAIEIIPRDVGRDEKGARVKVEIAMTKGGDVETGAILHQGETLVQAIHDPRKTSDALGAGQTYLVVTPEIVE